MLGRFPRASDPPYYYQAPKNPMPISPRPASPAPQIPNQPIPANSPTLWARPWHTHTRASQLDETSGRFTQIWRQSSPANSLRRRRTAVDGVNVRHRFAMRRRRGLCVQAGPKAGPAAQGVDPRGIWTGWVRQKSADAAPDRAGRMADHAGRRPGPASRWRLGSQSPLLYFITYFLKRLVDSLQVVVRLFQ